MNRSLTWGNSGEIRRIGASPNRLTRGNPMDDRVAEQPNQEKSSIRHHDRKKKGPSAWVEFVLRSSLETLLHVSPNTRVDGLRGDWQRSKQQ